MQFVIVNPDKMLMLDGVDVRCDFELDEAIHAIQWNGSSGEVEYVADVPNERIDTFKDYQYLVDAYNVEAARVAEEERLAELAYEASLTYADRREGEYPKVGDQLDDLFRAGYFSPEMSALIQAAKDKYPK